MTKAALAAVAVLVVAPVQAAIPIVETEDVRLSMGGYARFLTLWGEVFDPPDGTDRAEAGIQNTIVRAELDFSAAEVVALQAHARLSWTVGPPFSPFGAGVTPTPRRTFALGGPLTEQETHAIELEMDRLALKLFLGDVDLTLGRQAITWGDSNLFPPADLWTTLSPFDTDNSQKRGVDALRATWGIDAAVELDFVVVDRDSRDHLEDLSGGVRAVIYLSWGDVWTGVAKSYEQIGLAAGLSAEVGPVKLRGEAWAAWDLDDEKILKPRATVGAEWYQSADFVLGGGVHYNGLSGDIEALERGEVFLPEAWYAGLSAIYKPWELVTLTFVPFVSLEADPQAVLTWTVGYAVAQDVDLGVGGFHTLGDIESNSVFLQLAAFL